MSNHDNFNLTDPAELERLSLDELNAILDGDFASDDRVSTDTILLVLEEIEKRVGNTPSPTLDAAWETIKKEHLRPAAQGAEAEHETDIENGQSIAPKTRKPKKILPRIVGIAAPPGIPHRIARHIGCLWHDNNPPITLGKIVEVHLVVAARYVVPQAMQKIHHWQCASTVRGLI